MMLEDIADVLKDDLQNPEFVKEYLSGTLEDGVSAFLIALRDVVKANKGVAGVAEAAGLSRESLYRALSMNGNPEFVTVVKILRSIGYRIVFVPENELTVQEEQKKSAEAAA